MQKLTQLYIDYAGVPPASIEELPQSGSQRKYFRFHAPEGIDPQTVIGVIGSSLEENDTFIYLTEHFNRRKLPVPRILSVSDDHMRYLQTDRGTVSLYKALET